MGKQRELTWFKARNRWKKMINGKMYYFGKNCSGPQDQEGYEKAFVEYIELKEKLKRQALVNNNFQPPKGVGSKGIPDLQYAAAYVNYLELGKELVSKPGATVEDKPGIDGLVETYLSDRQQLVNTKQLSTSSFRSDYHRLSRFQKYCQAFGKVELEDCFSDETLSQFRSIHYLNMSKEKEGAISVRHTLRTVKALVKYAYRRMKIDNLPRLLDDYSTITIPAPKPKFFTVDEVHTLFNKATNRVKLWILLGINCGWTNVDVSTLEHDQIDWTTGIITRPRNKTGIPSRAKLFPLTKLLLREQMTDPKKHKLVFVTPSGYPLIHELIKEDGKPSKTDSIGRIFARLSKPLKIDLPFRTFRKTGAQMIQDSFPDRPWIKDIYLAHSQGIASHYVNTDFTSLFEATDHLELLFKFDTAKPVDGKYLIKRDTLEHDTSEV